MASEMFVWMGRNSEDEPWHHIGVAGIFPGQSVPAFSPKLDIARTLGESVRSSPSRPRFVRFVRFVEIETLEVLPDAEH